MKIDKIKLNVCGIYCIRNSANNHCYIGSSQCIYYRLLHHLSDLRRHAHKNEHLQRAWDKYGEDSFNIEIIECCDLDKRIERLNYALSEGIDFKSTVDQLKAFKTQRDDLSRQLNLISINSKLYSPEDFKNKLILLSKKKPTTEEDRRKLISLLVAKVFMFKNGRFKVVFSPFFNYDSYMADICLSPLSTEDHQVDY